MTRRQYPFHWIEPRWQHFWQAEQTFRAFNPGDPIPPSHPFARRHPQALPSLPPKYYILDMFPYPSGAGLHVGHPEGYTATDILARLHRARGRHVLHPMGWDAFGLPAEQFAVRTGQHPRQTTEKNIANFTRQIRSLGFSYDWSRELATTDPAYFRWTQWIFLQIYNAWFNPETGRAEPIGTLSIPPNCTTPAQVRAWQDAHRLAYVAEAPVWWCEALGTVLANEEVIDGRSEVGGHPVTRKPLRQWMLRITAYAGRLLEDLQTLEWSESLKEMQRHWIGRSEGAEIRFRVPAPDGDTALTALTVFTTRPDTLFGATYLVLAPDHPLVTHLVADQWPEDTPDHWKGSDPANRMSPRTAVAAYQAAAAAKSDLERTELARDKTGVFTGSHATHPVTGRPVPIWIADYVLASYGTGAIMAVPAHDTRDLEFAEKFNLPIVQVVVPPDPEVNWRGFTGDGTAIHSSHADLVLDGCPTREAGIRMTDWLEARALGRRTIQYKLRDWLFSRQRYWGEPFPIVWHANPDGSSHHAAVAESDLPILPPLLDDYKPTRDGRPPLARATDWVRLPDGSERETNTMPQWAGSCWYYLRYLDPQNAHAFVDPAAERYWMGAGGESGSSPGVDLYVGGTEHAVLHLLYARFWHKVLFDLGHVSTPEPFHRLVNQGLILGEDGQKMSKSLGNVVNPDEILEAYGADAFRLYEMFLGPLQDAKPWNTRGVEGVYRFLGRVWRLFTDETSEIAVDEAATVTDPAQQPALLDQYRIDPALQAVAPAPDQLKALHACIRKVTEDLDGLRFNTAIAALMVFVNTAATWPVRPAGALRTFLQLLAPFAPHLAEELWARWHRHFEPDAPFVPSLTYAPWPSWDPELLHEATREVPVQVDGRLRDRVRIPADAGRDELERAALAAPKVIPLVQGRPIERVVVVPGRLVNIVLRKSGA